MPSISIAKGKGSLNHNMRVFKANNVDPQRSTNNIILQANRIQEVYHDLFDHALERYNSKQTRSDRKISNYFEHIQRSKQEKPMHEIIVQIGNKDSADIHDQSVEILQDFYKQFQKDNPQLKVACAVIHLDEATPHLHIDYVPYITGQKRGLDTRVSHDKALKQMGYTSWLQWRDHQVDQVADIMFDHGLQHDVVGDLNPHLSVRAYKQEQRLIEKQLQELKSAPVDMINTKKVWGKEYVPSSQYEKLQKENNALKHCNALTDAHNKRLEEELGKLRSKSYVVENNALRAENNALRTENSKLSMQSQEFLVKALENSDLHNDLQKKFTAVKNELSWYKAFYKATMKWIHKQMTRGNDLLTGLTKYMKPNMMDEVVKDLEELDQQKSLDHDISL